MSGLGGLNKTPNGVVIGLVQLQLPVVTTPDELAWQTQRIVAMVGKARRTRSCGFPAGLRRQQDLGLLLRHGA
jgi:hypothetical protein